MKLRQKKKLAMSKTNSNSTIKVTKVAKGSAMTKAKKGKSIKAHQTSKKVEINEVRVPIIKNPPPTR